MNNEIQREELLVDQHELREGPRYHFAVSRRGFVQTLGAGLVLFAHGVPAWAQGTGAGAAESTIAARLHLGEDGRITVRTGKVEAGQGAKTQLAQAAAEELRVPLERIVMVMADTAVTPDDGGTAGSRTTPANVPEVRAAAATARQLLIALAAETWKVDAAGLLARDGVIHDAAGNRSISYADLARQASVLERFKVPVVRDIALTPVEQWTVLGKPARKLNARNVVTGKVAYPSDFRRDGTLFGKVLRAPAYNSTLVSVEVDAGKAEGVVVVRDGDFVGCAAPTSRAAAEAVEKIAATAQWKTEPHPSSGELWDYLRANTRAQGQGGRGSRPQTEGSVEEGLKNASTTREATYHVPYIQHVPMEPRAALAEWKNDTLTVWTGTQQPNRVRDDLAEAFSMPAKKVRVIVPDTGGGFGGKHTGEAAVEAARLAKAAGKPVSLQWTRAEEFTWAYCRPAAIIDIRAGLDAGGQVTAWDFTNYNAGGSGIAYPYATPNRRITYVACESPLQQGSYRALASTANNFARECFMDELAEAAQADPLTFRMERLTEERLKNVLREAADAFGWEARRAARESGIGIGLACGTEKGSFVAACVAVRVDAAKSTFEVLEICEAFECGAIQNPLNLKAQVEGCIIMGLGGALMEEMVFADGKMITSNFREYRVPRMKDVPALKTILLNRKDLPSVGAGETPIIAAAPAIANALFHATGKRLRQLPLRLGSA